jgi:signal transduction histidine kinase
MTPPLADWLFGWLPAATRPGALRRLAAVWGIALAIALVLWGTGGKSRSALDTSLVYSYAISTTIWLLSDPLRIRLGSWLRVGPPHFWAFTPRVGLYMLSCSSLGYALGTVIGDAYAGHSTWDTINQSPVRLLGFWVSGLVFSGLFVLGFYQRAIAEEHRRQATEARLKLLETQLEPHMLFNTLANLRALIAIDPPRAIDMLDRLNGYLRATLKASRTETVGGGHTLADEFARLEDYLALMAVRMGTRLRHTLELPEALARHPVPPLLLQPLVENAIRHGLEPQVDGGTVAVSARTEGTGSLVIEVNDTGAGMDTSAPPAAQRDSGFGLAQVRERIACLPGAGRVDVHSAPGQGTRITLTLPMNPVSPA